MESNVIEVNKDNFEKIIIDNEIVIMWFSATWSKPCKLFGSLFAKKSLENPDIVFGKVDIDNDPEVSGHFETFTVPRIIVMKEQIKILDVNGIMHLEALNDLLEKSKQANMDDIRVYLSSKYNQNVDGDIED